MWPPLISIAVEWVLGLWCHLVHGILSNPNCWESHDLYRTGRKGSGPVWRNSGVMSPTGTHLESYNVSVISNMLNMLWVKFLLCFELIFFVSLKNCLIVFGFCFNLNFKKLWYLIFFPLVMANDLLKILSLLKVMESFFFMVMSVVLQSFKIKIPICRLSSKCFLWDVGPGKDDQSYII